MTEDRQKTTSMLELNSDEFRVIQSQISNLNQQLSVAQAIANKEKSRSEELNNLTSRLQADFDNYRKRTAENAKKLKEDGIVDVVEKVIPLLDTFKQAILLTTDEAVMKGLKMIYKQFNDMLSALGITEIEALGKEFDPNLHNAIMQVKVKDPANINIIVEVFQKGFKMGDRIIRHSVVKVGH